MSAELREELLRAAAVVAGIAAYTVVNLLIAELMAAWQ